MQPVAWRKPLDAHQEGRILLTEDKDFGWLAFAAHTNTAGVVLIRFPAGARSINCRQLPVDRPLLNLANRQHIMPLRAQRSLDCEVATLVREKSHQIRLTRD